MYYLCNDAVLNTNTGTLTENRIHGSIAEEVGHVLSSLT